MRAVETGPLARILGRHENGEESLTALAAAIRPGLLAQRGGADVVGRLITLAQTDPASRAALRDSLLALFGQRRAVLLLATSGIFPVNGWLAETMQRLAHRVLPEAADAEQLHSAVHAIFRPGDARWLESVPADRWFALLDALDFRGQAQDSSMEQVAFDS
jgi:site-specific recombinase